MRNLFLGASFMMLMACGGAEVPTADTSTEATDDSLIEDAVELGQAASKERVDANSGEASQWSEILSSDRRADGDAARDKYRLPQETLEFMGIEPGMTVIEASPGGGWYSRVLLPYLGSNGGLVGIHYKPEMLALFREMSEEEMEKARAWPTTWMGKTNEWRTDGDASVAGAYIYGSVDDDAAGTADAAVFFRALHGLNQFEDRGGFRSGALKDVYGMLKPGGIVGVVQHKALEGSDDAWANGANGYLKESQVVAAFEEIGFELVDSSNMHANPKDQPTSEEFVWRLPPSLATSKDDPELAAKMKAIGESNRMTLKFRKPA
ncbi:MAG: methyltransferase [Pseudomonadota bacterium]